MEFQYSETVKLSYELTGQGSDTLILMHGFGLTKEIFNSWIPILESKYRLVSIDLFYHGDSERPHGNLTKSEWKSILENFLNHLNIDRFRVLGFSLGGRFAIASCLELAHRCDELILVAPDAVYKTPWFKAATTPGMKWVFKFFMKNPAAMHRLVSTCVRMGIISKYIGDFVERELGKPENRMKVYYSWNHFKALGYRRQQLREKLKEFQGSKHLVIGDMDIVIPPTKILPILDGCGFNVTTLPLKHHQLIKSEVAQLLIQLQ